MNVLTNINNECLSVSSPDTLAQRPQTKKSDKFICSVPDCQKIFRFKSDLKRHLPVHSDLRPHVCSYYPCTRAFKRVDALKDHIRSQHTHEASLLCPYTGCNKSFTTTSKLRYHTALHDATKSHKCPVPGCEKSFVTLSQLKQHQKSLTAHRNLAVSDEGLKCAKIRSYGQRSYGYSDEDETAANSEYHTTKRIKSDMESPQAVDCFFSFQTMEQLPVFQPSQIFSQTPIETENDFTSSTSIQETLIAAVNENDMLKAKLELSENNTETLKQQLQEALTLLDQAAPPSITPTINLENFPIFNETNEKLDQSIVDLHFNMDFDIGINFDLFKGCLSRNNSYL